jgi:hypothetical protein
MRVFDGWNVPAGFYVAWCDVCGCESLRKLGDEGCLVCAGETIV